MNITATHYETLHVSREASEADIDDAYRRLGRECLDGSMPPIEAEKQLKRIREAYAVIGDPGKREAYDRQSAATPLAPSSAGLPSAHPGSPTRTNHTPGVTGHALGTEAAPILRTPADTVRNYDYNSGTYTAAAPILRTTTGTVPHHESGVTPSSAGNARTPLGRIGVAVGVAVGIIGVLVAIGRANSGSSASQQLAPTAAAKPSVSITIAPAMTEPAPEVFVSTETVRKVLDSILRCDLIEETLTPTSDANVVRPCGTDEWVVRTREVIGKLPRTGGAARSQLIGFQFVGARAVATNEVVVETVKEWGEPGNGGVGSSETRSVPQRVTVREISGQWKLVSADLTNIPPAASKAPVEPGTDTRDAVAVDHLGAALALREAGNLVGAEKEIGEVLALGYTTATNDALAVRAQVRKDAMTRPTAVPSAPTKLVPSAPTKLVPAATKTLQPAPPPTAVPPAPTRSAVQPSAPTVSRPAPSATNPPQANVPPAGYFTQGSTKDEVLAKMGQPTSFMEFQWTYAGIGSVDFENGKVTKWSGKVPARLVPKAGTVAPEFLTQGSTKDEVLAKMGQPTSFMEFQWTYAGIGSVDFENGKVTKWSGKVPARLT